MRFLRLIWVFIALFVDSEIASAQSLTGISVAKTSIGVEVGLVFDKPARAADKMFFISEGKPRLVLDFKAAGYSLTAKNNRIDGAGPVKSVRFARRGASEQDLRLVLDLITADVQPVLLVSGRTLTLTLKVEDAVNVRASTVKDAEAAIAPRYFKNQTPLPRLKPQVGVVVAQKTPRKPVIVIDPGHGGRDPGAIGVAGTHEKEITWAASVELKRQLVSTGRYQVMLTRSKDVYVAHEERLRIARAGGADLFISIHADATSSASARGASVYTLADRAINRSKRIVNSQNWIMDIDLSEQSDPVGDILVDLAQRKTATQSDEFSEILIEELAKSTRLIGNTHRRAGYFVLLAPDVPAVLLELGFLSNAQDEKLLNKESHRKKVITSVTRAINNYFDKQKS